MSISYVLVGARGGAFGGSAGLRVLRFHAASSDYPVKLGQPSLLSLWVG